MAAKKKAPVKKRKTTKKKAAKPEIKHESVGRPSEYREEYIEQARKFCLLGATDKELADFFHVTVTTLNNWKNEHPEFLVSIQEGKEIADANVADRLYQRALGYSHPEVHVSNYQGVVTLTPLTKHYPPDTQAGSLWLRNRQPAKWRDKVEQQITGTGPNGELEVNSTMTPSDAYLLMLGKLNKKP